MVGTDSHVARSRLELFLFASYFAARCASFGWCQFRMIRNCGHAAALAMSVELGTQHCLAGDDYSVFLAVMECGELVLFAQTSNTYRNDFECEIERSQGVLCPDINPSLISNLDSLRFEDDKIGPPYHLRLNTCMWLALDKGEHQLRLDVIDLPSGTKLQGLSQRVQMLTQ
ncbi:phosphoglycerate mutase family protein, partial [Striga asiatica]